MSYGLLIRNASGELVVDGENPCAFLHEKRAVSLTNVRRSVDGSSGWTFREPDLVQFASPVATPEPPFIAGHAGNTAICMGPMLGNPGNWTGFLCYTPWWHRYVVYNSSSVSFTLNYAVFSHVGQTQDSSGSYGMQVFSSSGRQVFDSRKFPFVLYGNPHYQRFGANSGTEVKSNFNYYEEAARALAETGEIVNAPGVNHWPVLSGLNQMMHFAGGFGSHPSEDAYTPGALGKICVMRASSTSWRYVFRPIIQSRQMDFEPHMPSFTKIPNFGGGMGGVNLLLTAQVPS